MAKKIKFRVFYDVCVNGTRYEKTAIYMADDEADALDQFEKTKLKFPESEFEFVSIENA